MSDKKTLIGDKMIETQLNEKSKMLGISVDELIDRYIRWGLFSDDYYTPPEYTREELIEMGKKNPLKKIIMDFLQKNIILMCLLES